MKIHLITVLCALTLSVPAAEFTAVNLSTNRPAWPFTAGSVYQSSNRCQIVTFTIAGEPGDYDLQWRPSPAYAFATVYNEANATAKDRQEAVNPPITLHSQPVTISYAMPDPLIVTNLPPSAWWRLKRR